VTSSWHGSSFVPGEFWSVLFGASKLLFGVSKLSSGDNKRCFFSLKLLRYSSSADNRLLVPSKPLSHGCMFSSLLRNKRLLVVFSWPNSCCMLFKLRQTQTCILISCRAAHATYRRHATAREWMVRLTVVNVCVIWGLLAILWDCQLFWNFPSVSRTVSNVRCSWI